MLRSIYFTAILISVTMGSFGQYYKVLYTTSDHDFICNITSNYPDNYKPFDYENDGKNEMIVAHHNAPASFDILDGSTFKQKYHINERYTYNGETLSCGGGFYGFWDIDGDNTREAVVNIYPYDTLYDTLPEHLRGIAFINIASQTIEYFNNDVRFMDTPTFYDINNDGFNELITFAGIIGHSITPESQNVRTQFSKKASLSINAYPNPVTSQIRIEYNVPMASVVTVIIYNASGRQIKQLVNERKPAGNFTETWNTTKENGVPPAPGEYYYVVKIGDAVATKKIIVLK